MSAHEDPSATIGIARVDAAGVFRFANDRMAKILGVTREQILGRAWQILAPEVRDCVPEIWRDLRAGLETVRVETYVRSDGRRVSVQFEAVPEIDAEGRVSEIHLACTDVTAHSWREALSEGHRNRAAERLAELEDLYQNTPVGLCAVDRDLRYTRTNRVYAETVGYEPDDLIGRTMWDVIPESAREQACGMAAQAIATGEPSFENELRRDIPGRPELGRIWLANLHPLRRDGEVIGAMAVLQNVTEIRRAEESAGRRLRELALVYENTPAGLCSMDPELRVIQMNPLFARYCGIGVDQVVGRRLSELLPDPSYDEFLTQLTEVARTGMDSIDFQLRSRSSDGSGRHRTFIVNTHPARAEGRVTGLIAVLQDVTAFMDRQGEIEAVRDRLAEAQSVSRVGSWEWNVLTDEAWWSRELCEIFGVPPTFAPTYTSFFERVDPADRRRIRLQLDKTLQDGKPYRLSCRFRRDDGSLGVLFTVARLERTPDGQPARVVGTCQDITEFGPPPKASVLRRQGRSGNS